MGTTEKKTKKDQRKRLPVDFTIEDKAVIKAYMKLKKVRFQSEAIRLMIHETANNLGLKPLTEENAVLRRRASA